MKMISFAYLQVSLFFLGLVSASWGDSDSDSERVVEFHTSTTAKPSAKKYEAMEVINKSPVSSNALAKTLIFVP